MIAYVISTASSLRHRVGQNTHGSNSMAVRTITYRSSCWF